MKRNKSKDLDSRDPNTVLLETVKSLAQIMEHVDPDSSLNGLTVIAMGFSSLLQIYALPNANNPEGMCDDPVAFRRHFAEIVAAHPSDDKTPPQVA